MDPLVKTERQNVVFSIILNRPEKRNAITLEMYEQLDAAVQEAGRLTGIRAVILRGEGQAFSAGIDLTAFLELPGKYGQDWQKQMRTITGDFQAVLDRLERLEVPTIVLLHGYCLGLAMELALACDIRIAATGTKMGLPETRLGLIPDVGGTTRLTRLVGPARSKELIFTGRQIDASVALDWGILNYVVPGEELQDKAADFVAEIREAAPLAVGMAKRVIDGLVDIDRGLQLEAWAQSQLIGTEDFNEAAQAFMNKRAPEFKGR